MRKATKITAGLLAMLTLLTGCGEKVADDIVARPHYEADKTLVTQDVVGTDEELKGIVYNFVTGNITVDSKDLLAPTAEEQELIMTKMAKIESALKGKENNSIPDEMLNYMLLEFAKTQKEWQVKTADDGSQAIEILGIDPITRKIFVDVTYVTTENNKIEIPKSVIIKGNPLEESLKKSRYDMYMQYLDALQALNAPTSTNSWVTSSSEDKQKEAQKEVDKKKKEFEDTWGTIDSVLEEQAERTLIERIRHAIINRDPTVNTVKEDQFYIVTNEKAETTKPSTKPSTSDKEGAANAESSDKKETNTSTNSSRTTMTTLSDEALRYIEARGIGTYTYTGISKQTTMPNNAEMRFRYILDFKYNLGSSTELGVTSVYLMNYALIGTGTSVEEKLGNFTMSAENALSLSVIKPYVDRVIYSYHKCIEESDYRGLYKLFGSTKTVDEYTDRVLYSTSRFADWDKYYSDINRYCYTKFDAYDYEIIGWLENVIQVKVTRSKKIRGKGTEMSMPTYTESSLMTMVIEDDDIYIESEVILNTELVGEPVSLIRDVSGIASKIAYTEQSFSAENELAVIEALKKFSDGQLDYANNPTSGISYLNIDFGVGNDAKTQILNTMTGKGNEDENKTTEQTTFKPYEKVTWLGTWATKSNVYCKVRIREYFKCEGKDIDTEAYVGLVKRDDAWTIVSYERTMAQACRVTEISDKGCLSHDYLNQDSTSDLDLTYLTDNIKQVDNIKPETTQPSATTGTTSDNTSTPTDTTSGTVVDIPATTTASTTTVQTSVVSDVVENPSDVPTTEVSVSTDNTGAETPSEVDTSESGTGSESVTEPNTPVDTATSDSGTTIPTIPTEIG